jgi:hypothetical protein
MPSVENLVSINAIAVKTMSIIELTSLSLSDFKAFMPEKKLAFCTIQPSK